ncbi:MAG TPA: hypothetical protein VHW26_09965 [Solirubrobacteraceae bacterium]|jgi:hypothetical protein|nr:hypothetical protein [Solirubrobacteraceae bacterium]
MKTLGLIIAALAIAPLTATAAAAPWSPPAAIPGAPDATPILAQSPAGPVAVYWDELSLTMPISGANLTSYVSPLGPGLEPQPAQLLSQSLNIGSAAAYGNGQVALDEEQIGIATGPVRGPFAVHHLPMLVRAIAADPAGDIAGVVEQCDPSGCDPAAPQVVIARHGHAFGHLITVDRKGSDDGTSLAIDPHGRVLVAWDRNASAYARFISLAGRLSPVQRLGRVTARPSFDVVLSADGRAAVGWTSQSVDEGEADSPFTATLALDGSSGHFGRARVLGRVPVTGEGSYVPYAGLAIALPAGHSGLAAWTGYQGSRFVVRAASIRSGRAGTPQTVSDPTIDTVLADAAEGPHGAAVILLLPGRAGENGSAPGPDALTAATHPSGTQTFGTPEPILPVPAAVDGAYVGIDGATGAVFAVWRNVGGPLGWSVRTPLG